MARQRTGTIQRRGGVYWVRHTINTQGVTVRRWFALGTTSLAVARAKNARLLEQIARGELPDVEAMAAPETCSAAFARVIAEMRAEGLKTWKDRQQRLQDYAVPVLGELELGAVTAANIRDALDRCRAAGKSKQTLVHLRNDLRAVFDALWRADQVTTNPVAKVQVPKQAREDDRPRQLLTDEEVSRFVACEAVSLSLRTMAIVSRVLGGLRTSDLHAWRWEHIDTAGWTTAKIRRPKTRGLSVLELPALLKPWLQRWWRETGSRTAGPVFPVGRGRRPEAARGRTGYAKQLRAALQLAGITRPELFEDTAESRRVDFHSFRRAYATALADAGINAQQAMALAGHTKLETHLRYVDRLRPLATPDGVFPVGLGSAQ
jgi:integrase